MTCFSFDLWRASTALLHLHCASYECVYQCHNSSEHWQPPGALNIGILAVFSGFWLPFCMQCLLEV